MRELDATTANFAAELETLLAWDLSVDSEIDTQVANIIKRVRTCLLYTSDAADEP